MWNRPFLKALRGVLPIAGLVGLAAAAPAQAGSAIFGGGPFYAGGTSVMNDLRASGFTTVVLWCIHVDSTTGNLILNDQLVVSNGVYVGNSAWPAQLATLKTAPTSVNRIEVSVGSWGVNDFLSIQTLMNSQGTNSSSILYRNFQALKTATGATAIDFDDETLYDVATTVKFGQMLSSLGCKVSLCPYTDTSFWQTVYAQLGSVVDAIYLQCYSGGAGNSPSTWNGYFSGLKVSPGLWCLNGSGCTSGSNPAAVAAQMLAWRSSAGIPGGFMWLYDDMQSCASLGATADYAYAINQAVDPLQISPGAGFTAITSYAGQAAAASTVFTLSNAATTTLSWGLVNTSAWLSASATTGSLGANGSATVTVSFNPANATNLPAGQYAATIGFTNLATKVGSPRVFSLNTAVANWPVALSGFNAALLASNNATAAAPGATAFDLPNNYCLYQAGLSGSTRGLPFTGLFTSLSDSATAFQLGPYGANDALLLGYNSPKFGALTLARSTAFSLLAVLACSANAASGSQGTLVLNFTDGSKSPPLAFNAQDWFYNVTNVALQGFGRLKLGSSLTAEDNGAANPNLYQTSFNLAALGLARPVSSITFSNPAGAGAQQTTAILAVSGLDASVAIPRPTGLTAIPGTNGTALLSWIGSPGATNYQVKQALVSGGPYTASLGNGLATNVTRSGLGNGTLYYFTVSALGVSGESGNAVEVSARPGSYRGWMWALNPAGYWPLNETVGTNAYELVRGSNGFYAGSYVMGINGVQGAGFGSPHSSVHYSGTTGYTQVPLLVGSTNFTLTFWVSTVDTGGTPNWYNGKGLLDGEVAGTVNDFGVALVGTKAGFGVGNPDTTITSGKRINDGAWHQVVVTRDAGTGLMQIFIDGALDTSGTGPTGARTAPPALRLGSLQTGASGCFLIGNLCEVAVYNQVLTPAQVLTLYRAATGLFYHVTLTNSWNGQNLVLTWPGNGLLLEATNLPGPWITNRAASPVTLSPTLPQNFYRVMTP